MTQTAGMSVTQRALAALHESREAARLKAEREAQELEQSRIAKAVRTLAHVTGQCEDEVRSAVNVPEHGKLCTIEVDGYELFASGTNDVVITYGVSRAAPELPGAEVVRQSVTSLLKWAEFLEAYMPVPNHLPVMYNNVLFRLKSEGMDDSWKPIQDATA